MFSLICVWKKNGWVNDREAGDLRRYLAHYDVTVMVAIYIKSYFVYKQHELHREMVLIIGDHEADEKRILDQPSYYGTALHQFVQYAISSD